jgi:hypothetical protein
MIASVSISSVSSVTVGELRLLGLQERQFHINRTQSYWVVQ